MQTQRNHSPATIQHYEAQWLSAPELRTLDPTQDVLQAQLLGEEEVRILVQTPRFDGSGNPIPSPYYNFNEPINFSDEAIQASAFRLAAETLPRDVVEGIGIEHDIPDNVAYQHPPSLDTIGLALEAWSRTGFDHNLKNAIEAMCAYSTDTFIIDDLREAMENAELTHEPIALHRGAMVASRETPAEQAAILQDARALALVPLHDPNHLNDYDPYFEDPLHSSNEEYHERLVKNGMVAYAIQETVDAVHEVRSAQRYHEEAEAANERQRQTHSAEELELLREQDVAVKVDMSDFLDN